MRYNKKKNKLVDYIFKCYLRYRSFFKEITEEGEVTGFILDIHEIFKVEIRKYS